MITKAYIHEYGNNKVEPEHLDVHSVLVSRGIECEFFTTKRLARNQLKLDASTLVVGDHPTLETVFKRIGYQDNRNSYPISLRPYLKRKIWESTAGKLLMEGQGTELGAVFIKPKDKSKLFTGFVLHSKTDLYRLDSISKQTKLYCSTVVEWLAEYRVFVNESKIVGIIYYKGDPDLKLNLNLVEVEDAILNFEKSTERTAAYGIDFGILENGETALIEWNDGFALGGYGLDKTVYTDLILTRWTEIQNMSFFLK